MSVDEFLTGTGERFVTFYTTSEIMSQGRSDLKFTCCASLNIGTNPKMTYTEYGRGSTVGEAFANMLAVWIEPEVTKQ